jgi:hypothetical protein
MALQVVRQLRPSRQLSFPDHEHATDHRVLVALREYQTKERLKAAAKRPPCAEVAARRIREYLWDLGAEKNHHLWIAEVARKAELNYTTVWALVRGYKTRVGPDVVDQITRATGCPIAVFYDAEF